MALIGYDAIAPLAAMELPGLPYPVLMRFINLSAMQLCNESQAWQADLPIAATAELGSYTLALPVSAELIAIRRLLLNGAGVPLTNKMQLDADLPGWESVASGNVMAALTDATSIRLVPPPSVDCALTVRVALRPRADATQIDEGVLSRYQLALANGAKSMAMMMPNQAWSNPPLSQEYRAQFREACDRARIENMIGFANGAMRMQGRRFGD